MPILNITAETWVGVPGFDNYEINTAGIIRSKYSSYVDPENAKRIDRAGYWTVRLNRKGKTSTQFIHRLLAHAFITNPDNKRYVNHKNGIKTDNRLENLEWVTHQENVQLAYNTGLISKASQIRVVVDTCTGNRYNSVKEAAQALSIPYSSCKNYLNGNRPNITTLRYAA